MLPVGIVRLFAGQFSDSGVVGEGKQLCRVVSLPIVEVVPEACLVRRRRREHWASAASQLVLVAGMPGEIFGFRGAPLLVNQFESGVLVGVPDSVLTPRFREGGVYGRRTN